MSIMKFRGAPNGGAVSVMRSSGWRKAHLIVLVWLALILAPSQAWAFCGFFASSAKADVYNDVTQVALMRHGTTTVLSMRNTYKGPPEDFAMVVPVPQVLKKEDVKTLNDDLFDRLDKLTAPRLVEYLERDPCAHAKSRRRTYPRPIGHHSPRHRAASGAEVEASFKVGEYDVEILSAKDSTKLESWLKANGYNIPKGASKALAPYIAQGMYFFVAKVDAKKVKFDKSGEAMLSPLRFAYDSEDFTLPVRLGLLNSKGKQDLSVFLLSTDGRYEVSNYPNAFIPTNLVVKEEVRHDFSAFYDALLQRELDKVPGAVVTEYAWNSPNECGSCPPSGALGANDLDILGRDVLWARYSKLEPLKWTEARTTRASRRWSSREVIKAIEPALISCYESLDPRPLVPVSSLAFSLELDADNTVLSRRFLLEGFEGTGMEPCVQHVMESLSFEKPARRVAVPAFAIASVQFSRRARDIEGPRQWVLTRMRARYSPKEIKDDLRFVVGGSMRGGRDDPEGNEAYFTRFDPIHGSVDGWSAFQARYIIPITWKLEPECKSPQRGIWNTKYREGKYVEVRGASGGGSAPKNLSAYIISGPKELMSRAE